jgi:integrase
MPQWSIRQYDTNRGTAFQLNYSWNGHRHRPTLGLNLTPEQIQRRALDEIQLYHNKRSRSEDTDIAPTLRDIVPLYWKTFKTKNRVDRRRPEGILNTYLVPFFGNRRLKSLTAIDGLNYITQRQEHGATSGTIRREYQVLNRLLNLAVDYDLLDKNRLKRVDLPEASKRTRVAEPDELDAIRQVQGSAVAELWRVMTVALNTGLRESKLLSIRRSWIRKREDGYWLQLPPARTRIKGNPLQVPLNRVAMQALAEDVRSVCDDRVFRRWEDLRAFRKYWASVTRRAKVGDLRFHDLRHTFATRLQRLGVGYELRQALLGHKMPGTTADYSHGGPEWDAKLRDSVNRLELAYPGLRRVSELCRGVTSSGV